MNPTPLNIIQAKIFANENVGLSGMPRAPSNAFLSEEDALVSASIAGSSLASGCAANECHKPKIRKNVKRRFDFIYAIHSLGEPLAYLILMTGTGAALTSATKPVEDLLQGVLELSSTVKLTL